MLFPLGRAADAGREIDQVVAIAARSRRPDTESPCLDRAGDATAGHGRRLGLSYGLMKDAERVVFPAGPYRLKRTLLSALGSVAFRLGRLDEALATFEALDALAASAGRTASPRQRAVQHPQHHRDEGALAPVGRGAPARLRALAERALATATEAQSDDWP